MRYGIEFDNGYAAVFGNFENRHRSVFHSGQTLFTRYRRNYTAVDAVMPDEEHRVIRMNGQKAFDERFGTASYRLDGFGISGKHVVRNGFSRQAEFFFGFSLPIPERRFAEFLREFQTHARMVRHNGSRGIGGTRQIARIGAVDPFAGKPFGYFGGLRFAEFVQRSRKMSLKDSRVVFYRTPVAGEDDFHKKHDTEILPF